MAATIQGPGGGTKADEAANKQKVKLIPKGYPLGPHSSDVAWEPLISVPSALLAPSPETASPEHVDLLHTAPDMTPELREQLDLIARQDDLQRNWSSFVGSLPPRAAAAGDAGAAEDGDADRKSDGAPSSGADAAAGGGPPAGHRRGRSDVSGFTSAGAASVVSGASSSSARRHAASVAFAPGQVPASVLPYAPSADMIQVDWGLVNPYPTPEEDGRAAHRHDRSQWEVGHRLDYKEDGVWYAVTIKAMSKDRQQLLLGFDGYHKRYDTWVDRESRDLAPLHKFSETSKQRALRISRLRSRTAEGDADADASGAARDKLRRGSVASSAASSRSGGGSGEDSFAAKLEALEMRMVELRALLERRLQGGAKPSQSRHPSDLKQQMGRGGGGFSKSDEDLIASLRNTEMVELMKEEILRQRSEIRALREENKALREDADTARTMLREALQAGRAQQQQMAEQHLDEEQVKLRRSSRSLVLPAAEKSTMEREDEEAAAAEDEADLVLLTRTLTDAFQQSLRETQFRVEQLESVKRDNEEMQPAVAQVQELLQRLRGANQRTSSVITANLPAPPPEVIQRRKSLSQERRVMRSARGAGQNAEPAAGATARGSVTARDDGGGGGADEAARAESRDAVTPGGAHEHEEDKQFELARPEEGVGHAEAAAAAVAAAAAAHAADAEPPADAKQVGDVYAVSASASAAPAAAAPDAPEDAGGERLADHSRQPEGAADA
jgi:hypothetical protein